MRLLIVFLSLILFSQMVLADQTVKTIELPIDFKSSAGANIDFLTQVNISVPDRIEQILFAEIILTGDFAPTTGVKGRVNTGKSVADCNPTSWITPLVNVYGYDMVFDCTNLLKDFKGGTLDVGFSSSLPANNVRAKLKLTYYNKPLGNIKVFGTEYIAGDKGTIFLQLTDEQGIAVQNGNCLLDAYEPASTNSSHPQFLFGTPMLKLNNSDSLHFFDLTIPNITGVYMLSATCTYTTLNTWVHDLGGSETKKATRTPSNGTFVGDTLFLNDYEDWIYTQCTSQAITGTQVCDASYTFNTSHLNLTNITSLQGFYTGEASRSATTTMQVFNWSSQEFIVLPNNLTYIGGATAGPVGIAEFMNNEIPIGNISEIINDSLIKMRLRTTFNAQFVQYNNWLNLKFLTSDGIPIDLKGSGELHVSSAFSQLNQSITNVPTSVWSFNGTVVPNILTQFVNAVWDYSGTIATNILNQISDDVWTRTDRNLTFYPDANISGNITTNINVSELQDDIECIIKATLNKDSEEWEISIPNC